MAIKLDFFGPRVATNSLSNGDLFLAQEPGVTYLAMKITINVRDPAVLILDHQIGERKIVPRVVALGSVASEVIKIEDAFIQPSFDVSDLMPGHANKGNESTALYLDGAAAFIIAVMKNNGTVTVDLTNGHEITSSVGHLVHTQKWKVTKRLIDGSLSTIRSFV